MADSKHNLVLAFEVHRGSQLVKTSEFSDESITIGKGPAAMLSVEDASIADLHCVINVEEDGSVQLLDLGSDLGTKVNGVAVANQRLTSGDTIEIGDLRIGVN